MVCLLALVGSGATNTNVQTFLWELAFDFFCYISKSGIARSCGSSIFNFSEDSLYCFCSSLYHFTFLAEFAEKAMAPHSSILAWKIPWTEEPGGLQSIGLQRVRHIWATLLSLFTFMHWRRKWQPTPVCLPGESQGRGSLVGCHLWGCTESDTTEAT